jgi:flagellar basal-body rod protein FlgB
MDFLDVKVVRMINHKMGWLSHRQRVLAQNIANADTPKYIAKDLKEVDFEKTSGSREFRLKLANTHKSHIQSSNLHSKFGLEQEDQKPYETSPTGNSVVLEDELIKVANTVSQHQLMTGLYRKQIGMFRLALGKTR